MERKYEKSQRIRKGAMDVYQEHGSSIGTLARMVETLKKGGNFQVSGFAQACKNHFSFDFIS
jgi:hypothetical protein